ncbi:uncharacterized protein [Patagioenas fasciata]|uniref:uncharacterized protein n=1 Tax=Patagioenas fasciata TaxID=372321 RepID=UPI003A99B2B6
MAPHSTHRLRLRPHLQGLHRLKLFKPAPQRGHHRHHHTRVLLTSPSPATRNSFTPRTIQQQPLCTPRPPHPAPRRARDPRPERPRAPRPAHARQQRLPPAAPSLRGSAAPSPPPAWARPRQPLPPASPPCRWWGAPGCRCCSWWGKASPSRGPTIQARQPVTLRLQRCPPLRTSRHLGRIYAAQGGGEVAAQAGRKEEGRRDESPFEVSTGVTEEQLPFRKTCSLLQTSAAPPRDSRPVLRSPVLPVRGTVQECAGQSLPAGEAAPPAQSGRGRRREVRRRCRVAIRTTPEQDARSVAAVS